MIKDNALSNRLNAVKAGKEIPKLIPDTNSVGISEPKSDDKQFYEASEYTSIKSMLLSSLISFGEIAIMSLFYGFGLMTLLTKDWNILGIFGVGLLVDQIFSIISSLKHSN
jgi:hypothetical protein